MVNVITVKGIYAHCENDGGWILGHLINGTQAEYVRVPFADNSLYHAPESLPDEALVMLSDILPTGYEIGVLKGKVKPGNTVAIVGNRTCWFSSFTNRSVLLSFKNHHARLR